MYVRLYTVHLCFISAHASSFPFTAIPGAKALQSSNLPDLHSIVQSLRQPVSVASIPPHRLLSQRSHRLHIRPLQANFNHTILHGPCRWGKISQQLCQKYEDARMGSITVIFCQNGQFPAVALVSFTWLMGRLNNRVYVKHSYRKEDEKKGSHSREPLLRMRCWRLQERKKKKKRPKKVVT